ncbi:MAG: hypothetical protein KUG79_07150 [Pseudomonadales bacterium]|nr:hypothetical protein [Pseudomonadales bacterium]
MLAIPFGTLNLWAAFHFYLASRAITREYATMNAVATMLNDRGASEEGQAELI